MGALRTVGDLPRYKYPHRGEIRRVEAGWRDIDVISSAFGREARFLGLTGGDLCSRIEEAEEVRA